MRLTVPFNVGSYGDVRLELRRNRGIRKVKCVNAHDQYRLMVEACAAEARGDAPPQVPLALSRANQVALDELLLGAGEAQ